MSQLVKTKRQANFKDFKRFGAFKGLVEQKNVVFNSFVSKLGLFGTRGHLKRSFYSRFKLAHSCQKRPNLHTNSLNMPRKTTLNKHLTSKVQFAPNFTLDSVADGNYRGKCDVGGFLIFEWTRLCSLSNPPHLT
jgi:hypothetical protein